MSLCSSPDGFQIGFYSVKTAMPLIHLDFSQLLAEYAVLGLAHACAQRRCSEVISELSCTIEKLQRQLMTARAAVVVRDTAMAFVPSETIHLILPNTGPHSDAIKAGLDAADLVICQTGCLSHGEYWRVQDHCKRTGKTCVLVEQPEAVRIVRIHKAGPDTTASA